MHSSAASPDRVRGRQLQSLRQAHFRVFPLCVECAKHGRTSVATQLDHIVAIVNGGVDSLDPFENRQGLCTPCHLEKTARDLGHEPRPKFNPDGNPQW